MSLFKSCHRCAQPYEDCKCDMFNRLDTMSEKARSLEDAYDQPNAKSLEQMNLLLRLDKALDELNKIRNEIAGV